MPPLKPLKEHSQGEPSGYLDHSVQRHTLGTTSNQQEPCARVESGGMFARRTLGALPFY